MRLPGFLQGVPHIVIVLAVPAIAFAAAVGISLGTEGGSDNKQAAVPTVSVAVTNRQPLPAASPQPLAQVAPAATPISDRTDCNAIRGGDYRSTAEQDWFKKNCGPGGAATVNTASASSSSSNTSASASTSTTAAARPAVTGAQVPSGQRLVIPAAKVNTDIDITKMSTWDMPDPKGYFNVLAYDMSELGGVGNSGTPGAGNFVLAGHVDCGRCYNGGSGTAVFWNIRDLKTGDSAQVVDAAGKTTNYVVTRSAAVGPGTDWNSILGSSSADMTLVTCTGTFNAATHEYDQRHYVSFKKA